MSQNCLKAIGWSRCSLFPWLESVSGWQTASRHTSLSSFQFRLHSLSQRSPWQSLGVSLCWLCILRLLSLPACPPCSTKLLLSSSSCLWSPEYQPFPSQSNSSWLIQGICPWRSQENSILCFCLRTLWTWLSYFYICNLSEMGFFVRVRKVKIPHFKKNIKIFSRWSYMFNKAQLHLHFNASPCYKSSSERYYFSWSIFLSLY